MTALSGVRDNTSPRRRALDDPSVDAIRGLASYKEAFAGAPLISVCIATYQRARILCERTLPTVLRQTYRNWEAVIIGDGCHDDTAERIAAIGDARIRFYNRPANGPYPAEPRSRWLVAGTYASNAAIRARRGAGSRRSTTTTSGRKTTSPRCSPKRSALPRSSSTAACAS